MGVCGNTEEECISKRGALLFGDERGAGLGFRNRIILLESGEDSVLVCVGEGVEEGFKGVNTWE